MINGTVGGKVTAKGKTTENSGTTTYPVSVLSNLTFDFDNYQEADYAVHGKLVYDAYINLQSGSKQTIKIDVIGKFAYKNANGVYLFDAHLKCEINLNNDDLTAEYNFKVNGETYTESF